MKGSPRFFISRGRFGDGYELKFGICYEDNSVAVALPVEMQHVKEGEEFPESPMLKVGCRISDGDEALQSLMDELWREGFRPKDIGTPGHIAAMQEHLNDMRAIVAKQLDVKL